MSVTAAAQFIAAYDSDSDLRSKLQSASNSDDRQKVMADAGFGDVTKQDIDTVRKHSAGEMSEEDLGAVAGAGSTGGAIGQQIGSTVEDVGTEVYDEVSSWFDW